MLKLLLPVLIPSWRFFSSIGPSPRIQYAFIQSETEPVQQWIEFRLRPQKVSLKEGLLRLFHNPRWNETLYINTCAERLFEEYSLMREKEIMKRLLNAVVAEEIPIGKNDKYLVYRIVAIMREGQAIVETVTFIAAPEHIKGSV